MPFRFDTRDLGHVERTPAGGLRVPATVAREGVLTYPWGREYVPQSTLDASVRQLNGLPVSLRHPRDRRVDAANWQREAVGHAGEDARMDDDAQSVTVYVQRADAVEAVESRRYRQLSMGYDTTLDPTPGVTESGERYDAIQTARSYNHIALVERARGGDTLALRLDEAGDAVIEQPDPAPTGREIQGMIGKIRIDGIEYEIEAPESFFQAHEIASTRQDKALKAEKARADEAEGKAAGLETKLAEETRRADEASDPARLDERVKARADLEATARKVLGADADLTGKTDREVMELAVRTDDAEDLSSRSDDYIRGAFEIRTATAAAPREDGLDRVRRAVTGPGDREEPRTSPLQAAISRLRQDQAEAATRQIGGDR